MCRMPIRRPGTRLSTLKPTYMETDAELGRYAEDQQKLLFQRGKLLSLMMEDVRIARGYLGELWELSRELRKGAPSSPPAAVPL